MPESSGSIWRDWETASDTGPILWMEAMCFRAQIYLKHYPLPQEEFIALVRKTVDLDLDNAAGIVYSYTAIE